VPPNWKDSIDPAEWSMYRRVAHEARSAGVRFAFGGAFATAVYTGELRNTKDFDFYILAADRESMRAAIRRAGLHDHYERLPYDRSWIYRASDGDVIVDAIWAMANLRAWVEESWLTTGPEVTIYGERMRALPIEELIWTKLYVLQRERCDWADVLNLIQAQTGAIDWNHLINRLGEDAPLLAGALSVFGWLAPLQAQDIPAQVWALLGLALPAPDRDLDTTGQRASLLDSRPWFGRPDP
jgi:hypothetical protein